MLKLYVKISVHRNNKYLHHNDLQLKETSATSPEKETFSSKIVKKWGIELH